LLHRRPPYGFDAIRSGPAEQFTIRATRCSAQENRSGSWVEAEARPDRGRFTQSGLLTDCPSVLPVRPVERLFLADSAHVFGWIADGRLVS
jgi:hypothetical protein